MNASLAFAILRRLGVPAIDTADAASALKLSTAAASQTLTRLAHAGLIRSVRHGRGGSKMRSIRCAFPST